VRVKRGPPPLLSRRRWVKAPTCRGAPEKRLPQAHSGIAHEGWSGSSSVRALEPALLLHFAPLVDAIRRLSYNAIAMPVRVPDHWLKKLVMKELYKREIDISRILVFCTAGVVTIMGELRNMHGHDLDLKVQLAEIENIVRQIHGVRDIINQVKVVEI